MAKSNSFHPWTKSPLTLAQTERKAKDKGCLTRYIGSVLYVHKAGNVWFKFMHHRNRTYYRRLRNPPQKDNPVLTVPSFFCAACERYKKLPQMKILQIDRFEYTICLACANDVFASVSRQGCSVSYL